MKKIIFQSALLLIIVSISSAALAQSTKAKYFSSEAKLSVTFPSKFETTEDVKEAFKSVKTQVMVNGALYYVSYSVHKNDLSKNESLAKVSLDSFIETLNGKVTKEAIWKVRKKNGLQALFNVTEGELKGEYRVVIIGQIQYQIAVVAPKESWDEKVTKKFFKSFKVKK
ncbi:MAG: hypothetical protein GQ574_17760 [Crocinitomix sp.]|nr:hypothetical protein [Crocinitomix sp.]